MFLSKGSNLTTDSTNMHRFGLVPTADSRTQDFTLPLWATIVSTSVPNIHRFEKHVMICPTYFSCMPSLRNAIMSFTKWLGGRATRSRTHHSGDTASTSLMLKSLQNWASPAIRNLAFLSAGSSSSMQAINAKASIHRLTMWSCSARGAMLSQCDSTTNMSSQFCKATCAVKYAALTDGHGMSKTSGAMSNLWSLKWSRRDCNNFLDVS